MVNCEKCFSQLLIPFFSPIEMMTQQEKQSEQQQSSNEVRGKWIQCVVDNDYEIFDQYPYQLRRKSNKRIVTEGLNNCGYVQCAVNGNHYYKHRVIALQFIPNPNNHDFVDHINHVRSDNRVQNLRWVTGSENSKNKTSNIGVQYQYFDQIPNATNVIPVNIYGKHLFANYYYNSFDNCFYFDTGVGYRRLHIGYYPNGSAFVHAFDVNNKDVKICYIKFKRLNHIE